MTSYEIAYLLNPDATPEEVVTIAGGITQAIERSGGNVQYVAEPKKRKLAYYVNKHGYAYFGYTDFAMEPGKLAELKKALALDKNILRFIVVYAIKATVTLIEKPYFGRARRETRGKEDAVFKHPKPAEEAPKATPEEIDKKLEEILK